MFTQEQEVKRSKEWKVVMAISSILIIVIAVFFLFRMFHSNPLEGTWVNEENDMTLKIKGGTTMVMEVPGALDGNDMELQLKYTIDPVSYTHLDVYKRQIKLSEINFFCAVFKSFHSGK